LQLRKRELATAKKEKLQSQKRELAITKTKVAAAEHKAATAGRQNYKMRKRKTLLVIATVYNIIGGREMTAN
jgi:hypothetical protein